MSLPPRLPWRGPPLALQITALLLGGLVVAQLVTLFLTLTFPPAPAAQYGLRDIAAALSDQRGDDHHGLNRIVQAGPPDVSGPGWLVSEKSRRELARLMNVDDSRVSLAFYTPLPFAGTAAARSYAMANDGMMPTLASMPDPRQPSSYIVLAQFTPGQAGPMAQMAEGRTPPSRDAFPPGMFPGSETGSPDKMMMPGARIWRNGAMQALRERARGGEPLISVDPRFAGRPEGIFVPGDGGRRYPRCYAAARSGRRCRSHRERPRPRPAPRRLPAARRRLRQRARRHRLSPPDRPRSGRSTRRAVRSERSRARSSPIDR
jgi:two-component system OmpR family sensor kinase